MAENKLIQPAQLLVIGGSAGSLEAILTFLPGLDISLNIAVIIIVHRKPSYDTLLADLLGTKMKIPVKEAEEKEEILPNHVYIAPADYHLLIEKDATFSLDVSEKINHSRPSIDVTFESAAEVFAAGVIAILLSGANADGVEGMKKIKANGGICIVQDPASAEVDYMPGQAIARVTIDKILPAREMAEYINELWQKRSKGE